MDLEISHEEFIIIKKKKKNERVKENLRNINEKFEERLETWAK